MILLALSLALFSPLPGEGAASAPAPSDWTFPETSLEIGSRLPNFMLPRVEGGAPVALYDLLAGKPTLLHIYASW